jgi:hypothetical protein
MEASAFCEIDYESIQKFLSFYEFLKKYRESLLLGFILSELFYPRNFNICTALGQLYY